MTKSRKIFFRVGAWACIATAVIHMAGQLAPRPAPATEAEALLDPGRSEQRHLDL
jgi:hypothetical protein